MNAPERQPSREAYQQEPYIELVQVAACYGPRLAMNVSGRVVVRGAGVIWPQPVYVGSPN